MNFKLDENFGKRIKDLFIKEGHNVETVLDENLSGSEDELIYNICCKENKCLVTLDLDFSNIMKYPPGKSNGIVIFRLSTNLSFELITRITKQFLKAIKSDSPLGKLWIVEFDRIRIHEDKN